ncbi:MurR/RpiR family transcriptional regulator [Chungangia koreensis]|uniref:MurR/RpiR family transcriptional regulator n=1 Tax=Chungangia koreensis TaxID=752657 RepID=A0ABV8X3B4_9LACT
MHLSYVDKTKEKFPSLSKGLKKVADQLLTDPIPFAIHTAKKVGTIIGVSETMVIRFCHEIGYPGYTDLQKELRQSLLDLNNAPLTKTREADARQNPFSIRMEEDLHRILENAQNIEVDDLDRAIELIINSDKVIVAGYYHSFSFAHWLSFSLNYILGNASLYRPASDAGLFDLPSKNSCVIIFSFFRYAIDMVRLAEEAKEKGIQIITITDSRVSPVADIADIVIPINNQKDFLSKGPITLSLINAMLAEIIERVENRGTIQPSYKYFVKDGDTK